MRNIPTVTRYLLIVNVVAFLLTLFAGVNASGGYRLNDLLGLHFFMASDFQPYQLLTYMFMHGGFDHIFFNMFALWMFGCIVERTWGPRKFLLYYLICGVGAGVMQEIAQFCSIYLDFYQQQPMGIGRALHVMHQYASAFNGLTTVGASGAIYAILLAFGMLFPNEHIFMFPLPVPIKAKWFVAGYAVLELVMAMMNSGDNVAHLAHLGGMLFGYLLIRYWQRHPNDYLEGRTSDPFASRRGRRFGFGQKEPQQYHYQPSVDTPEEPHPARDARQEEINQILEKIRKSGYESLTFDEKQKLFHQSN